MSDVLRCELSTNPCGTDTWEINSPCKCSNCQAWLRMKRDEESAKVTIAAFNLYEPPFKFFNGYIFDASDRIVADQGAIGRMSGMIAMQIRGWGRIQYDKENDPAELQDEVGKLCALALTHYWENHMKSQPIRSKS